MAEKRLNESSIVVSGPASTSAAQTPVGEAAVPSLRLSDLATSLDGDTRGDYDNTPADYAGTKQNHDEIGRLSGGGASRAATATAAWALPAVPEGRPRESANPPGPPSEVDELRVQNRLLRQTLALLRANSSLKQAALIGTVLAWFGDMGLLDERPQATDERPQAANERPQAANERLHSADGSSSAPTLMASHPPLKKTSHEVYDHLRQPDEDQLILSAKSENDDQNNFPRSRMNEDTSEWLDESLDTSFNPPFSSSKKVPRRSPVLNEVGKSPEDATIPHAGTKLRTWPDFEDRLRRMETDIRALCRRRAETQDALTGQRKGALRRFRVWKAVAASRRQRLAADPRPVGDVDNPGLGRQSSVRPTPLIQYPMEDSEGPVEAATRRAQCSDQTILGEIAFQTERRILAYVFQGTEILCGYNLGNLGLMMRTHPDLAARSTLAARHRRLTTVLRGYGWLETRHPQLVAEAIARHGLLDDVETARAVADARGWRNSSELKRGVLCLCPVSEVLDTLVILDCLLHMVRQDGQSVFLW